MSAAVGAAVGLVGGVGLALMLVGFPAGRRPDLADRIGPYLGQGAGGAYRSRFVRPGSGRGLAGRAASLLDRAVGGSGSVRRRLVQAGREPDVERFRLEQVAWGAGGLALALALSVVLVAGGGVRRPAALVVMCAMAVVAGALARDRALTRVVARRQAGMLAEFPTLAELLALAVSAGEGPVGAIERVTAVGRGELARELAAALAETRSGVSLTEALTRLADRTGLPSLGRFVDGVAVALERGTPLAEVLRAQAADAREAGRRDLLELGARREIAMMLPVVFLILPVTVLFALYPGLITLRMQV